MKTMREKIIDALRPGLLTRDELIAELSAEDSSKVLSNLRNSVTAGLVVRDVEEGSKEPIYWLSDKGMTWKPALDTAPAPAPATKAKAKPEAKPEAEKPAKGEDPVAPQVVCDGGRDDERDERDTMLDELNSLLDEIQVEHHNPVSTFAQELLHKLGYPISGNSIRTIDELAGVVENLLTGDHDKGHEEHGSQAFSDLITGIMIIGRVRRELTESAL